jgi:hypothetical protein
VSNPILSKIITGLSVLLTIIIEGTGGWLVDVLYHNLAFKIVIIVLIITGTAIIIYTSAIRTKLKKKIWYRLSTIFFILFISSSIGLAYFSNEHIGQNKLGYYLKGSNLFPSTFQYMNKEGLNEDQLMEDVSNQGDIIYTDIKSTEKKFFWLLVAVYIFLDSFFCSYLQLKKFGVRKP